MSDLEPYLEELDQLLLDQGDEWMLLTQLDGYLTGILVSPDTVTPSVWLRSIWAGATVRAFLPLKEWRISRTCSI